MDSASNQVEAASRLVSAARELAETLRHIPRPSDSTIILKDLHTAQQTLETTYRRLAAWHREAEVGVHHAGGPRAPDVNPGWLDAEVALEEAAQYGADAATALDRARASNEQAEWFDEIRVDSP